MVTRFEIARSRVWWWLLAALGATASRSMVEVDEEGLDVTFGAFHQRFQFSDLTGVSVALRHVPWYRRSLGWRTNFMGRVGLIGTARDLVRLELAVPRRVWLLWIPVTCRELLISLREPDAFVAALAPKLSPR